MIWVDLVAIVSLLQFVFFGALVGRARGQYGVKAPAMTGHEMFERLVRVHMNTLELLVVFVPALYLAARYWSPLMVAGVGAIYVVGRLIYWQAYVKTPQNRTLGFVLSAVPVLTLLFAALIGMIQAASK